MILQNTHFARCLPAFIILMLAGLSFPEASYSFELSKPGKTKGELFPHILKAETYTLNTRNVKSLTRQGHDLWVGTTSGLIRYNTFTDDDYQIFDNQSGLLSNSVFTVHFDKKNFPWVGTYGGGLSYFNAGQWENINTPQGLSDAFVYDVEFHNNDIWIATWSGANMVSGDPSLRSSWTEFTIENTEGGLIDNWVYAIEIAQDGTVWFGTESGVSRLKGNQWKNWNHTAGLGAPLRLVERDNEGIMGSFKGSHHAPPSPDIPNPTNSAFRPNYVVSMLLDEKTGLWIGTWGGGLSLLDIHTSKIRNFTVKDGLPGNYILALKKGPQGNLWIGTNNGLSRFNGTTFENFAKLNGLVSDFIFSIEFGPTNYVWLGGHYGMNRLEIEPKTGTLKKTGF